MKLAARQQGKPIRQRIGKFGRMKNIEVSEISGAAAPVCLTGAGNKARGGRQLMEEALPLLRA